MKKKPNTASEHLPDCINITKACSKPSTAAHLWSAFVPLNHCYFTKLLQQIQTDKVTQIRHHTLR